MGGSVGLGITTGNNITIGDNSLGGNGSNNVVIGYEAGSSAHGMNNVLIGAKAGQSASGGELYVPMIQVPIR